MFLLKQHAALCGKGKRQVNYKLLQLKTGKNICFMNFMKQIFSFAVSIGLAGPVFDPWL